MKDAESTWAVVIGIDTYDHFKGLTGAARDAVAVVGWLRRLGVPDGQILLHAAPHAGARAEVDALGLPCGGCTEPEIWRSFRMLIDHGGARLFVFLSGHGFFEPGGDRVFLTREADSIVTKNLGIEWYARFLRGLPYRRQFLVMDGCLNLPYTESERARFKAGEQSGVEPRAARADVMQILCHAASQGERALEVDGRGIFCQSLVAALDPDDPDPNCVDIDDATGTVQLDIVRAVNDVAAPTVTARAAELGRNQHPGIQRLSAGSTAGSLAVVEIPPQAAVRVRVSVDPRDAAADVQRLTLWSDLNAWRRVLPVAPAREVQMPHDARLPQGLPVAVRCTLRQGVTWVQPTQQEFVAEQDRDVVFRLKPPTPPEDAVEIVVNTVGPAGEIVAALSGAAYDGVERIVENFDVDFALERHETGPVIKCNFPRRGTQHAVMASTIAFRVADAINSATPDDIAAVISGIDADAAVTAVVLELTPAEAQRLAGLLDRDQVVEIGDVRTSLSTLVTDPEVMVDGGPVTVRVTLPWGSWVRRVPIAQGKRTPVRLPTRVGVPPLRVSLLRDRFGEPGTKHEVVVGARTKLLGGRVVDLEGRLVGQLAGHADDERRSAWRGRRYEARVDGQPAGPWQMLVEVDHGSNQLRFPLSEAGALAVQLGRSPRVEPLSLTPSAHWDRLVSSRRVDDLPLDHAVALTWDKWDAPLLGLAGAYACFAQEADEYLRTVLDNLAQLAPGLPDLPILEAALDRRRGVRRDDVRARLVDGAVPVFRWGVAIGLLAAEHYGQARLAARLRDIEQRLLASSTWTIWRAAGHQP